MATYEADTLWDLVAHVPNDEKFHNNCLRFYEAAFTKMPHDAVEELQEKVTMNHPNKTYVRDTIGSLILAGVTEDAIAGSLRLIFL